MGVGRENEALKYLKMATRADKWKLNGRFDEAEIYLQKRKNEESINAYVEAVSAYARELKFGIDCFLLCCTSESKDKINELTQQALSEFFANDDENEAFEKLKAAFTKIKDGFHYY